MMVADTITVIVPVLVVISGAVIILIGVPALASVMSDTIMMIAIIMMAIAGAVIIPAAVILAGGFVVMSQTDEDACCMRGRVRVQIGLRHRMCRACGASHDQHRTQQRHPSSERNAKHHERAGLPVGPCSQDSSSRSTGRWTIR